MINLQRKSGIKISMVIECKKKEKRVDHFHNAFVKNFRIIIGNFERICVILNDRPDDECYRENA